MRRSHKLRWFSESRPVTQSNRIAAIGIESIIFHLLFESFYAFKPLTALDHSNGACLFSLVSLDIHSIQINRSAQKRWFCRESAIEEHIILYRHNRANLSNHEYTELRGFQWCPRTSQKKTVKVAANLLQSGGPCEITLMDFDIRFQADDLTDRIK